MTMNMTTRLYAFHLSDKEEFRYMYPCPCGK